MSMAPVMSITEELLAELDEKAKAATPGPWRHATEHGQIGSVDVGRYVLTQVQSLAPRDHEQRNKTAAYIATASPATILALIATIRAQAVELERGKAGQAVLDGWQIVPVDPSKEMLAAMHAYSGNYYTHPFDADDFARDYAAMLSASPAAPARVAKEPVLLDYPHEEMDAIALARYRVGASGAGTLHKYAVRAGGGEQELWRGSNSDCEAVARKLAGAFLDGGMCLHGLLYASPPAAEQPDTVKVQRSTLARYADHLQTAGYNNAADDLRTLLAEGDKA